MKNLYPFLVLAFLVISFDSTVYGQTNVPSIISTSQTWNAAGSPYIISGNTLVEAGVQIRVNPGVTIESTTDKIRIIVDGEFAAFGKKDSIILCDLTAFEFTAKSVDYDSITKKGSQFHYVFFKGNRSSAGDRTLDIKETSMLISNCKFQDNYYAIYAPFARDSTYLIIQKSIFLGTKNGYGYPVYASGTSSRLFFIDNYVQNMAGLYFGKYAEFKNNTFRNMSSSQIFRPSAYYTHFVAECNLFQNFKYTVMEIGYPDANATLKIKYNTFDTADYFITVNLGVKFPKTMEIKHNNFLSYRKQAVKFSGGNTPGKADTFALKENYWGTTNTTDIEAGITDFQDDITIAGFVDYGNYRSSMVKTCAGGGTIGDADTSSSGSVGVIKLAEDVISIFPNPTSGIIHISYNGNPIIKARVLNLNGQTQQERTPNSPLVILDLSTLSKGVYIIEVQANGWISRKRILLSY